MITLLRWGPRGDRTPCATMCRTCLCNANGGMNHGHNVRECPITIPGGQVVAGSNPVSPTTNTLPTSAGRGVLVEEARGDPNRAGRNLKLAPSAPCTQHRARPGPPLGQVDLVVLGDRARVARWAVRRGLPGEWSATDATRARCAGTLGEGVRAPRDRVRGARRPVTGRKRGLEYRTPPGAHAGTGRARRRSREAVRL